jgi:hypothetical protein
LMKAKTIASTARKHLKLVSKDKYYYQVNLQPHHDGSAHIEDLPNGGYRYVCTERGQEYNERITDNPQDILYWIYKDATFEIACKWEMVNRVSGQDSRRLIFSKQLELLKIIGDEYALRMEKEIEAILLNHPFNDRRE